VSDFRVSSTTGEVEGVTFYFIESTAPDHVDPPFAANGANPSKSAEQGSSLAPIS